MRHVEDVEPARGAPSREGVPPDEATSHSYALGSRGLLLDNAPNLWDLQQPYARPAAEVAG